MSNRFDLVPLGALALDAASGLHRAAFAPLGERAWTRQDLAELLASPGVSGFLLQVEGRDVGFALCRVAADEAELLTIAIDAGYRRRGAATHILRGMLDKLASVRSLYLEVGVDNFPARSLYEQMGFEEVGRRARYYQRANGEMADALIMRLGLEVPRRAG